MNSITVSLIAFAGMVGGVFVGDYLRRNLPSDHLTEGAKDIVRLGTGLLGTLSALVLGLMIASANSLYDNQTTQIRRLTSDFILLDRILEQYGPEARGNRALLRSIIDPLINTLWQKEIFEGREAKPFEPSEAGESISAKIEELSPQTEAQRWLKGQALQTFTDLAQGRLELFARAGSSIPAPFLTVLILWLMIIFASFSLFSALSTTLIAILCIHALSAAGAIFLILELSHPFSGLMQISSSVLRHALAPL